LLRSPNIATTVGLPSRIFNGSIASIGCSSWSLTGRGLLRFHRARLALWTHVFETLCRKPGRSRGRGPLGAV
jgi:hypothetical protein